MTVLLSTRAESIEVCRTHPLLLDTFIDQSSLTLLIVFLIAEYTVMCLRRKNYHHLELSKYVSTMYI